MRALAWVVIVVGCGGGAAQPKDAAVDAPIDAKLVDASLIDAKLVFPDASGVCNPLTQAGCNLGDKCTWLLDALNPQYVGHVGCAPSGAAAAGDACMYGAPGVTGFDNCAKGLVCGNYRGGTGVCKQICDQQGGNPMCGSTAVCVTYTGLFSTGATTPAAGGVCDVGCDPLEANDFDGAGALTKTSTICGTTAAVGCYGYPSFGTPPKTGFSCTNDINSLEAQPIGLRHRVQCIEANNCADPGPTIYVNSCNQGYLPLLRESSMVSTAVCVAMCKPRNCYSGNCGTNDVDRLGEAPHRCNTTDAVGTFDTSLGGEHCTFMWYFETDQQNTLLRSPHTDTLGFCYDHSKYPYDSNGDTMPDTPLPPCASLQLAATGTDPTQPLTFWGAQDLGCVTSTLAGFATGKPKLKGFDGVRPLYRRDVNAR